MSNPLLSIVEIETRSEIDNFYNETTRFQCQTVNGENVDGGGFSVLVPGTDGFRYFEFDSNYEASGMAHGQYNSQSCRKMTKTSK
jgi:hypothetical protein